MKGIFRVLQSRGGGGLGGFGGSYDFQGEPREDQSPLTEYKWGTVEDWLPMKGIIRILQSLRGGRGGEIRYVLFSHNLFFPSPQAINNDLSLS